MPSPPNIDGLPIWLQIVITLCFGSATLLVAFKGYFRKEEGRRGAAMLTVEPGGPIQQVQSGIIADMGAIRNLNDVCIRLCGHIESLEVAIRDQTHWTRNQHELDREVAQRLRELREILERRPI